MPQTDHLAPPAFGRPEGVDEGPHAGRGLVAVVRIDLHRRHHELVDYITQVATMSERMTVETIGYSHERRPILFVVVTSPQNHARLGEIRQAQLARTRPLPDRPQPVPADLPVVTWLVLTPFALSHRSTGTSLVIAGQMSAKVLVLVGPI